ncbi:hypothetical protein LOC67_16930 [Stieleria sp. JC731]|uniref:hypothetical protein n=1 Tax=Stieleria sp. JC731 TaxID=2894195 RepID=UPI001E56DB74|nr:hypothetical protein [Stieleria sp. JC731]MCC9602242.1 hypothetical protein [Stieleria sp. JC731]
MTISIGPIVALVSVLVPVTLYFLSRPTFRWKRHWRPKRLRELSATDSPMSISCAAKTIEMTLRRHWRDQPRNLHRLDRLLVFSDPDCDYAKWDDALIEVQTWPDSLDEPTDISDRILWDFQTFIDSNHCTTFSAERTKTYFLRLVATLSEAGIDLPDADKVTFNAIQ